MQLIKDCDINKLRPWEGNPRKHDDDIKKIKDSIKEHGYLDPIEVDKNYVVMAGHGRLMAAKECNMAAVNVILHEDKDLTKRKDQAYVIANNKTGECSEWDFPKLKDLIIEIDAGDLDIEAVTGFDMGEIEDVMTWGVEPEEDEKADSVPSVPVEAVSKLGEMYQLGEHRLICGDCTQPDVVEKLMQGEKADMVFTDPPYGMKKEKDGVLNDNLNLKDLFDFNMTWIPLSFGCLKDNGSWYCWGTDEPLMDIYSGIIKPYTAEQKATFRNLITWDKGHGQGQNAEGFRMYPIADEKCLFVMCGVQGFNNNADNYFHGWDNIVKYLSDEKDRAGLTIKECKRIAGHSENSGCHWFDKSQWSMPTREVYNSWREHCAKKNTDAFKKEYDEIKKEYDEIKKEYDEIKKEYYATRAYFNNTHDNMNNVWHFARHERTGVEGGHATPKPIDLCSRGILSSCPDGGITVDFFLGSGSTLIACEKTKRKCYGVELEPKHCDVIRKRWAEYTQGEGVDWQQLTPQVFKY